MAERLGNIERLGRAAQRHLGRFLEQPAGVLGLLGRHGAGEIVLTWMLWGAPSRATARQADHRRLGRRVVRVLRMRLPGVDPGDVDDLAAALLLRCV